MKTISIRQPYAGSLRATTLRLRPFASLREKFVQDPFPPCTPCPPWLSFRILKLQARAQSSTEFFFFLRVPRVPCERNFPLIFSRQRSLERYCLEFFGPDNFGRDTFEFTSAFRCFPVQLRQGSLGHDLSF